MASVDSDGKISRWRDLLAQWQASGLSGAGFCRENDLSYYQFKYWLKRIRSLEAGESGLFARVSTPAGGIHLVLPGGLRLELEPDFDEATLQRFLRAAGSC
jgi:hypothetical protein